MEHITKTIKERNKKIFDILKDKEIIQYTILVCLSALSWLGYFDQMAYLMNSDSLRETTVAFVTIKAFSAIISFANNLTLIGSIFEPINEFLDRMSLVMLISLMSLGLQKILLVVLQSFIVNFIISFILFIIIVNKITTILSDNWSNKLLKLTIILVVIRFSIPMMSFMIYSMEISTKNIQQEASQERVDILKNRLLEIDNYTKKSEKDKLKKYTEDKNIQTKINDFNKQILENEQKIKTIKYSNNGLINKAIAFVSISSLSKEKQSQILVIKNNTSYLRKQILIHRKKINTNFFNPLNSIKTALINLEATTKELLDVFITSTILFLFKNLIFPLLFMWGLAKLVDGSFKTNYSDTMRKYYNPKEGL